jgi:hypothetical protein
VTIRREVPKVTYPSGDEIADLAYQMLRDRMALPVALRDVWRLAETELLERASRQIPLAERARDRRRRP